MEIRKREQVERAASKALLAGKSVVIDRMHLRRNALYFVNGGSGRINFDVLVHVVVLTPPKRFWPSDGIVEAAHENVRTTTFLSR
jgi:hypothetical protein